MTDLLDSINRGEFDAIDFGSGAGGSAELIQKKFGFARIAGIEVDRRKVDLARSQGRVVLEADAVTVDLGKGVVRAATLFHVLEHLSCLRDARTVLTKACVAAREFVLVKQPYFGSDEELLERGLKLSWSTWRAHSNKMTTLDFYSIFSDLTARGLAVDFRLYYAIPVTSTDDKEVLPLECGSEELGYDVGRHPAKAKHPLRNVYREVAAIARLDPTVDFEAIEKVARVSRRVYPG